MEGNLCCRRPRAIHRTVALLTPCLNRMGYAFRQTENEAELVIRTPDLGVWYVGVYGYNKAGGAHGEIAIWASFDCATPCANGVCHPTSTACECEAPYTGDNCDVCVEVRVLFCFGFFFGGGGCSL